MAEKEKIFSSKIKHSGFFSFKDFYGFCYNWLADEAGLDVAEKKYTEKLKGNEKEIEVEWECTKKLTDYFKIEIKVDIKGNPLRNVEIKQDGRKTNEGTVEVKVSGTLIRDYEGKFEVSAFYKFLRSIYEKQVIKSRIEQYEDYLVGKCDEFLSQAKAYLDLEGKR